MVFEDAGDLDELIGDFEQKLDRLIEPEDIAILQNLAFTQHAKEIGNGEIDLEIHLRSLQSHLDLNDENMGYLLGDTLDQIAANSKATKKRIKKEKQEAELIKDESRRMWAKRKFSASRFIGRLALLASLGAAGGVGVAAYDVSQNPMTQAMVFELQKQKRELHQKFYGPLSDLSKSTPSSFDAKMRGGYFSASVGLDLAQLIESDANIIYDGKVGATKISANGIFDFDAGRNNHHQDYLTIVKKDEQGGILCAYIFESSARKGDYADLLDDAKPFKTIIFEGKNITLIDHDAREIITITYDNVGKKHYMKGSSNEFYDRHAQNVLGQFKKLYERGPVNPVPVG